MFAIIKKDDNFRGICQVVVDIPEPGRVFYLNRGSWHCEHRGPLIPYVLRATPQHQFCSAQAPGF